MYTRSANLICNHICRHNFILRRIKHAKIRIINTYLKTSQYTEKKECQSEKFIIYVINKYLSLNFIQKKQNELKIVI